MEVGKDNVLRIAMERCQQHMAASVAAREYLALNGVLDPRAITAYRVGAGSPHLQMGFAPSEKHHLAQLGLLSGRSINELDGGILLPTFDPHDVMQPVGFIKMAYAQNKHHFATVPAGIAIATASATASKIVLTETPLLGLRLAQAGAAVGIVEDVAALLPLADWLSDRTVVLASYKTAGMKALKHALDGICADAPTVIVHTDLSRTDATSLSLLGTDPRRLTIIPPKLVSKITAYAQDRLQAGHGVELLKRLHADMPEFISVYGVGYIPKGFSDVLDEHTRYMLNGVTLEDSVVIPAIDAQSVPVDLLIVRQVDSVIQTAGLQPFPMGLLASKIATAFQEILIVDEVTKAAERFSAGARNALLVRGELDVQINAARLRDAGVRSVRLEVHADHVADAARHLRVASIDVEDALPVAAVVPEAVSVDSAPASAPVTPISDITLIAHDPKAETAVFAAGDLKYEVEVSIDPSTRLQVRLTGDGKIALDRFDLASEAQRHRFAMSAAMRTKIPYDAIEQHLIVILDRVTELQASLVNPDRKHVARPEIPPAEKQEALEFLRRPDLLDAIAHDLDAIGWVGEERNKRLLYLSAVSRKLPSPLSIVMRAPSGVGKSTGVETIVSLTPPEEVLHCSRLTESSLYYANQDLLRHKLLVVDEADALTPEVLVALRVLQSRGSLTQTYTQRDLATGATTTQFIEAKGPVAVLMSTTQRMDEQSLSRCFDLAVDDSEEQTRRILEIQRRLRSDADHVGARGKRAAIVTKHANAQRLIQSMPVVIPFADRIEFPTTSIKHRREQERFLNLIEASALLHQHQRLRQRTPNGDEYLIADVRDFEVAASLASEHVAHAADELSVNARDVLALAQASRVDRFTIADLKAIKPDWTRHKLLSGLDELQRLEIVTSPVRGRGKLRQYVLQPIVAVQTQAATVALRPDVQLSKLSKGVDNNFTPEAATG